MDNKTINLIDFALCYLMSNSDDEGVVELFEHYTDSKQPQAWADLIAKIRRDIRLV